jgi:hypothetical protein
MKKLIIALGSLLLTPLAQAQWKTTTYTLKGGWNAIYLPGDATYDTLNNLLPDSVLEVWRWNPNPTQVGFTESPLIPSSGTAEWSVWKRGLPAESSLTQLIGQMAYLVKCSGTSASTYSVPLKQSPQLPANSWVRNGANLLGFPTYKNGSTYPTMSSYFATFPAAIAANTKVYKYVGGDLGPGNPQQVFSPNSERLDATQAYWFSAEVTGDFYAPLEISPASNGGLAFGRDGSFIKVLVRNRSAAAVTLTLTPVDSESAPSDMTGIVGKVPLTKRSFNATSLLWTETPINSAYTETIGANTTVELIFGINRGDAMMTAASSDALFASLLRLTDSSNLMEVDIPATAQASSLAGLWIGDVSLTNVSNKVSNGAQATATLTDGVITGLTVVGSGGFGYTNPPVVTIAAPHANGNTTATAIASVTSGALAGIAPVATGSGYSTPPSVSVAPPTATATATASISNGALSAITLTQAGGFYTTTAPIISIEPPPDSVTATASASVGLDKTLSGISVSNGGYYYYTAPAVTVEAPTLDTATATAVMTGDRVTGIQINNPGSNYTTAPNVTIAPQPSAQATAISALSTTRTVAGITPLTGGGYYNTAPTVTISAPDAAAPPTLVRQATATAVLTNGAVTSYLITDPGSNYLTAPTVIMTGGTFKTPVQATASSSLSQPTTVAGGTVNGIAVGALPTVYSEIPTVTVADPPDSVPARATATVAGGRVTALAITTGGSNYVTVPQVLFSGGTGASFTAALGLTAQSFTFTPGTQSYSTKPVVTITEGGATTAATANAILSGGSSGTVTGITLLTPGVGYTSAPTFIFSGGVVNSAGTLATAVGNAKQFTVSKLTLVNGGSGYSADTVAVSIDNPPAAQAATADAVLSGGAFGTVTGITLTSPGTGYLSPPDVSISAPDTETVTVVSDGVGSFSFTGGAGYTTPPIVTLSDPPAGTQATATAVLADGRVTGVNLIDPGSRYSSAPSVTIAAPPAPVQATASCVLTAGTSGSSAKGVASTITINQAGKGYLRAPTITFSDPPNLVAATATAILSNGAVTGYQIDTAGTGYATAPTVTVAAPQVNFQATATATVANGSVTGFTINSGGSGYELAPEVTINLPPPLTGSSTPAPFKLRTLLHLSDGGTASLLSEVYLGQLAVAPHEIGLSTSEALLKQDALASAQCFSSSHLPMDQVITSGSGYFATGQTLKRVINVPYNDATNPFVHAYHPDHDNKDARGQALGAGVESPNITRTCQFIFTASPPAGSSVTSGWGSSVIGGTYVETMIGVHKDPLILSGTFELRRASQIGTLSRKN